jgi:hypothetical protein
MQAEVLPFMMVTVPRTWNMQPSESFNIFNKGREKTRCLWTLSRQKGDGVGCDPWINQEQVRVGPWHLNKLWLSTQHSMCSNYCNVSKER